MTEIWFYQFNIKFNKMCTKKRCYINIHSDLNKFFDFKIVYQLIFTEHFKLKLILKLVSVFTTDTKMMTTNREFIVIWYLSFTSNFNSKFYIQLALSIDDSQVFIWNMKCWCPISTIFMHIYFQTTTYFSIRKQLENLIFILTDNLQL